MDHETHRSRARHGDLPGQQGETDRGLAQAPRHRSSREQTLRRLRVPTLRRRPVLGGRSQVRHANIRARAELPAP